MLPIKPVNAPLYVIAVISNPVRYRSRYHLYRDFEKYIEKSGAILYTVELAFGDREFEVTDAANPHHIRVRNSSEIWHKENLINIGISRLPNDWQYVAWVDADVHFARHDWVEETKHLLQHYMFVQMFSKALDLGPNHEPIGSYSGFVYSWYKHNQLAHVDSTNLSDGYYAPKHHWHPGWAWAARREAINHVGGLIDWAITGSADRHMACAMIGQVEASLYPHMEENCRVYRQWCLEWQSRCERYLARNIGYMDGLLVHHWHGKKSHRRYDTRWKILIKNRFDPSLDLKRDWQGVWLLTDDNIKLRDDIRHYFRNRNEDSIDL